VCGLGFGLFCGVETSDLDCTLPRRLLADFILNSIFVPRVFMLESGHEVPSRYGYRFCARVCLGEVVETVSSVAVQSWRRGKLRELESEA
jgi:hypothetical protein